MRTAKSGKLRRVSILITNEQYEQVHRQGLSLSGLVRDLLNDRFSRQSVTISLSEQTRSLYDSVISNFGAQDHDLEEHLLKALESLLNRKQEEITALKQTIHRTVQTTNRHVSEK